MRFNIKIENLTEEIVNQMSDEQLIEFVKDLDENATSWEVTNALYEYFKLQHEIYKTEVEPGIVK